MSPIRVDPCAIDRGIFRRSVETDSPGKAAATEPAAASPSTLQAAEQVIDKNAISSSKGLLNCGSR